jgi:hypothetical protein
MTTNQLIKYSYSFSARFNDGRPAFLRWGVLKKLKTKTMELLKVGDMLYNKEYSQYSSNVFYKFATVERLTKTQAILSDGTRLVNEPKENWHDKVIEYHIVGDKYTAWRFETDEILKEAEAEINRQKIVRWFNEKKFTEDEKFIIYNTFETLGKI